MCIIRHTGSQMARQDKVKARERKPSQAKQAYAAPELTSPQCRLLLAPQTHRSHSSILRIRTEHGSTIPWGIVVDEA